MTYKHPAGEEFKGRIEKTIYDSEPWWPDFKILEGAPNVVLVVLDDTGFAHFGCYGSTIETPTIDALAAGGLKYTGFHTTALCSPTRASLLTGRNHHAVGMRSVSNMDTGFPNMRGAVTKSAGTIAEILREQGYATYCAGKWHLAPMLECTAAGPFHNWPLQCGFDRYYGFLQGETDQFRPELTVDNHFIRAPGRLEDGYHVSEDIVDQAMGFIRDTKSLIPEKPFFLYLPFGATHSPHQVPKSYMDKYRGRFDAGWDVVRDEWFARQMELGVIPGNTQLAPRNPGVRPFADLSENEQRFANRLQEAFAAMLDHTDAQIGRLREFLEDDMNVLDNTIFIVMSDNGASQEGGPTGILDEMRYFNGMGEDIEAAVRRLDDIGGPESHSNIPWGWAQAGNTPLKWYKQNTHGGGVRDPLIIHWPNGLGKPGESRRQFCHAMDIVPTLLDLLDIEPPEQVNGVPQMPIHGTSIAPTFKDADASLDRSVQYFEMLGHRGIWHNGWKAVTHHRGGTPFDEDRWELYNLDEDFSECNDLAQAQPELVKKMVGMWWVEAEKHGVLPLDDRGAAALFGASRRIGSPTARNHFVYYPPISHIVSDACPGAARGWRMFAEVVHDPDMPDGALIARGSINSGFVLYIKDGVVHFDYNCFHDHTLVSAPEALSAGSHRVEVEVTRAKDRSADVLLKVDDDVCAKGKIPLLLVMLSSTGMDLGRSLSPVCSAYQEPFDYRGALSRVEFILPPRRSRSDIKEEADAEAKAAMTRQ